MAGRAPRAAVLALSLTTLGATPASELVERGEYLLRAGGCTSCHTDTGNGGEALAGGRALETPFGVFHSPNITPHPEHGIGGWSEEDFVRALRDGVSPGGDHYYPVFPYTSYTLMRRADALAIRAYLMSIEPVDRPNLDHDLPWFMRWRIVNRVWKFLFFEPGEMRDDPAKPAAWNRGAYLVKALAHCGECHTPRNLFGAMDESMFLAGTTDGPDGDAVPNITPDAETGIGKWSRREIVEYLAEGMTPDMDIVGGLMAEVVEDGLRHLDAADIGAIAEYLESVPGISNTLD